MSPYVALYIFIIFSQRQSSIICSSGEYLMMEELLCRASVLFIMCVYDPTPTKAVVLEMCLPRSQVCVDAVHLERSCICILCMQQNYVFVVLWVDEPVHTSWQWWNRSVWFQRGLSQNLRWSPFKVIYWKGVCAVIHMWSSLSRDCTHFICFINVCFFHHLCLVMDVLLT